MAKTALHIIKKVGGGKFAVFDHTGKKRLSKPMTKAKAAERLQQIEYFKNHAERAAAQHTIKVEAQIGASKLQEKIEKVRVAEMSIDNVVPAIEIPTDIGIPSIDEHAALNQLLQDRLIDTAALGQHVRQAHWNIKGDAFAALHPFFAEAYDAIAEWADKIAERLVALDGYPDALLGEGVPDHALPNYPQVLDQKDHLKAVADSLEGYCAVIRFAIEQAKNAGDEITSNLFAEIGLAAEKMKWQVEAGLEGSAEGEMA